jgi:hypothetical protein
VRVEERPLGLRCWAVVRESDGNRAMAPGRVEASGRLTSLNFWISFGFFPGRFSGTDFKTECERPMNVRLTRPTSFRCINRHPRPKA